MKRIFLVVIFTIGFLGISSAITPEKQIAKWESENDLTRLSKELAALKSSDTDENLILLLSAIYEGKIGNSIKRIELLVELSENNTEKVNYYSAYSNYHLAAMLSSLKLLTFAKDYSDKAIRYAKQVNNARLLYLSYKIKAGTFYKEKQFIEAARNFKLALNTDDGRSLAEHASDFNNVALCYSELLDYKKAIEYYKKGLVLVSVFNKSGNKEVYYLIKGNIGTAYLRLNEEEQGRKALNEELNYYRNSEMHNDNYISSLVQLIELEAKSGNQQATIELSKELFNCIKTVATNSNRLSALDALIAISKRQSIGISDTELNVLHNSVLINQLTEQSKLHDGLTEFLYKEKINGIMNNARSEKQSVTESEQSERTKSILLLIICIALVILAIIGYFVVQARIKKNTSEIISKTKNEEMILMKQQELQQNIENQQQQLNLLLTNLKIKQQTETGFLEKIKDLKRNKNVTIDQVIKELQLGLTNLSEIDKKLIAEGANDIQLDKDLSVKFKEKHPELTNQELTMCTYFVSDLTAKEIGLLLNISDISVRVAKNKIKNKIGLSKESNLNEYLQSIIV